MWEDTSNSNGGKWVMNFSKGDDLAFAQCWETLLMGAVGEYLDPNGTICGLVASRRAKGNRISVWTRVKDDRVNNLSVGKRILQYLRQRDLRPNFKVFT